MLTDTGAIDMCRSRPEPHETLSGGREGPFPSSLWYYVYMRETVISVSVTTRRMTADV